MNQALILAAGSGARSNLEYSKVLYKVDKPIFMYSVDTFIKCNIEPIIVASKENYEEIKRYINGIKVIYGGMTRSESVRLGLEHVDSEYVFIHDAARPLITEKNISDLINSLAHYDAIFLARKSVDSVKIVREGKLSTVNRDNVLLAETPQVFKTSKIKEAYRNIVKNMDDDISIYVEYYQDEEIGYVLNDELNFKVTYKNDFEKLESILKLNSEYKIGHSFDIHRLVKDRDLILGGIKLDYHLGLLGHSDGDALMHAIAESILGALGLRDLGYHYPDTDEKYKDLSSVVILEDISKKMIDLGFEIVNIDATIYAEEPKMNIYIPKMIALIGNVLKTDFNKINIKATTYEKLESIGRKEAIASESVCLLKKKGDQ